jgi:signal transduction histidine kinase
VARATAVVRGGTGDGRRGTIRETTWWSRRPPGPLWVEIVLALAAGVAAFALAAVVCAAARGRVPALLLGALLLVFVLVVVRLAGIMYALPVGVVIVQAFDWYYLPPLRAFDAATAFVFGLFLLMSVIVAAVTTEAGRRAVASEQARGDLAEEQAALRRVATLVAGGAPPAEVFTAVADELGRLIGAEATFVARVDRLPGDDAEADAYVSVVGSYGTAADDLPVGFRIKLRPGTAMTAAVRVEDAERLTGDGLADGPYGAIVARLRVRTVAATPIMVGGHHWGGTVAGTSRDEFPPGAESRMADFMELAATAVANAEAEQKLRELAGTQAGLRRLAMLVAQGEPPEAVFAAVTREVLRLFGTGTARMIRYEIDGTATLLANEGTTGPHVRVGEPWEEYPPTGLTATVQRTGQAARVNDYHEIPGGEPFLREGLRSAVAMPVHVGGRLWGLIAVGSGDGPLPPDTEQRMTDFTDLVATAVANAQGRAEVMASRARIVAASDETRRRIERDLHDGAQQRLVAVALRMRAAAAAKSGDVRAETTEAASELMGVLDELREISRGIHPVILSEAGLRAALRALGRRSAVPVELEVQVEGRLPEAVEVAAYYVVSEMLTNAAKHAEASVVVVQAAAVDGMLRVCVRDDGVGGADLGRGSGLVGLRDRVEALGGAFTVDSPPDRGTTVVCDLPIAPSSASAPAGTT